MKDPVKDSHKYEEFVTMGLEKFNKFTKEQGIKHENCMCNLCE